MSESSWMMGGGRMLVALDGLAGRAIGSHIKLSGTVFGMSLSLDEVVKRRDPPTHKVWETVGTPRLLVIGSYTMGIEISPEHQRCRLRVFVDYELPTGWRTRGLGWLFGAAYAKWCVKQMTEGTLRHFARREPAAV